MYPIPHFLDIKKGEVYHVEEHITKEILRKNVAEFLRIHRGGEKHPIPEKMISSIGEIPLREIYDPQLKQKVHSLWAFDISYNPALSIKDVMARQMVSDALNDGSLDDENTIVEATSGNTGAGLALISAFYGFSLILVVPNKISLEKIDRLRSLGAHVIVTPTNVEPQDFRSYYSVRDTLGKMNGVWVPQQYDNPSNRKAHELVTGPQIWEQTKGKVTAVVIPTGTGGTISGIGRYLKNRNKNIKIIGVDTIGSILYLLKKGYVLKDVGQYSHAYDIQGFGEDIHPKNLDFGVIDRYIRVSDISGMQMTQMLPALGFFQGQSSGASYAALLESIDVGFITPNDSVVVMFPDSAIPYRHDVFDDEWMKKKMFSINY